MIGAALALAAMVPLTDPPASDPIVAAVGWLRDLATGSVATSIALIAVAGVGLSMLNGRTPARRGLTVLVGCFLLFGSGTIAAGIGALAGRGSVREGAFALREAPSPLPQMLPLPAPTTGGFDPYAGAAVPPRTN